MAAFTDAQTDAINAQGGSVLVSAAAGSGKTTVLIERIIRMITRRENPIDVDRLLIVTFTRAALICSLKMTRTILCFCASDSLCTIQTYVQ